VSAVSLLFCQLHDTIGGMDCSGGDAGELRRRRPVRPPELRRPEFARRTGEISMAR